MSVRPTSAPMPTVAILMGETASGKTARAIALAQQFDAEIVNADSRQIYRGMEIGTAAPTAVERAAAVHHLVAFLDPETRYSAAAFSADALAALASIHDRGKRAIIVGGTGFYVRTLCGEMQLGPPTDEAVRRRVQDELRYHGVAWLYEWLRILDAPRAAALAPQDPYRVARALEIALIMRGRGAEVTVLPPVPAPIPTLPRSGLAWRKFWVEPALDVLEHRIEERTDRMLADGLLDEAQTVGVAAVAANAVGYPTALAYLAGQSTYDECRAQLARATRQYAKRQRTWLRREPGLNVLSAHMNNETLIAHIGQTCGW